MNPANTYKAIAAMSINRLIGKDNDIPWNIPEDMKWFRQKTIGQVILMGRHTYDSTGKPLPGRGNVVLTRQKDFHPEGVRVIHALSELPVYTDKVVWVCGGEEVYRQTLPACNELFLTVVKQKYPDGEAFFPPFEHLFNLQETIVDKTEYSIFRYVRNLA